MFALHTNWCFVRHEAYQLVPNTAGAHTQARGWYENEDPASPFFDLKWTLKAKHVHGPLLHEGQRVNHFANAFDCLTTKVCAPKVAACGD